MANWFASYLALCTDGARAPDADNPRGYFEWSGVDRLTTQPLHIAQAAGKAVKIPSPQLRALPMDRPYHIIFMMRELDECARSQMKMRMRRNQAEVEFKDLPMLRSELERHREKVLTALRSTPNVRFIQVDFASLLHNPGEAAARIAAFLNLPLEHKTEAMAAVIDPTLYRSRSPEC
ncbi:MAG: sulfotransferase [Verrucomicrobiota bacterium]